MTCARFLSRARANSGDAFNITRTINRTPAKRQRFLSIYSEQIRLLPRAISDAVNASTWLRIIVAPDVIVVTYAAVAAWNSTRIQAEVIWTRARPVTRFFKQHRSIFRLVNDSPIARIMDIRQKGFASCAQTRIRAIRYVMGAMNVISCSRCYRLRHCNFIRRIHRRVGYTLYVRNLQLFRAFAIFFFFFLRFEAWEIRGNR